MNLSEGISANESFERVYNLFKDKFEGKEIKFPERAEAIIADDLYGDRTRTGYTGYKTAVIVKVKDKQWAIAIGYKCGDYPKEPYNCDIAAVPLSMEENLADEAFKSFKSGHFFYNSLIIALKTGDLFVGTFSNRFHYSNPDGLMKKIEEFIIRDAILDPDQFLFDGSPVVNSEVIYNSKIVDFLFEELRGLLSV